MRKLRVAILYGGVSAEHEISVVSARSVLAAIDRDAYEVVPIAISTSGRWLRPHKAADAIDLQPGALPSVTDADGDDVAIERGGTIEGTGSIDVVFPVLHGPGGEDGAVQGMLETLGVAYVGAGVAASAVGMDKSLQKPVFAAAGIPVTPWLTVRASEWAADAARIARDVIERLGFPCFVKPANLGSSVGVSKCEDAEGLRAGLELAFRHDRVALVEEAIAGRELECGVLGNDDPDASVVGEIIPVHDFYDYEAKYLVEGSRCIIPAELPPGVADEIRRLSVRAFTAIGCSGLSRVDFFLARDGRVLLNEINTMPGFTPISMYPKLWEASGIAYPKLIDRLIELAIERHRAR